VAESTNISATPNLSITRSNDYKTIYSNLFKTRVGNGEVTIIFSKITHAPSMTAEGNIVEEQSEIVMSWPQMKMFAIHLTGLVNAVERELGNIPIPEAFRQSVRSHPDAQQTVVRTLGLSIESVGTE
jgi:Protein of unknown function (DUF3467)